MRNTSRDFIPPPVLEVPSLSGKHVSGSNLGVDGRSETSEYVIGISGKSKSEYCRIGLKTFGICKWH